MSITSGYDTYKDHRLLDDGTFKAISRWTSSHSVEFDDGKTAEEKIKEITEQNAQVASDVTDLQTAVDAAKNASNVKYDNTSSGLEATNVQAAIDELADSSLVGLTATVDELNYVDGVTSSIQEQLNNKTNSGHGHTVANITDLTATAAELNHMDGVTSNVQTQLDTLNNSLTNYLPLTGGTLNGSVTITDANNTYPQYNLGYSVSGNGAKLQYDKGNKNAEFAVSSDGTTARILVSPTYDIASKLYLICDDNWYKIFGEHNIDLMKNTFATKSDLSGYAVNASVASGDIDSISTNGFYKVTGSPALLMHLQWDVNYAMQIRDPYGAKMQWRFKYSGSWSTWKSANTATFSLSGTTLTITN